MDPVSVLDYRYGTEEMRDVFRANSYLNFLLEVEATLAEAQAEIGIIPKDAAAQIRNGITLVKRERVEETIAILGDWIKKNEESIKTLSQEGLTFHLIVDVVAQIQTTTQRLINAARALRDNL